MAPVAETTNLLNSSNAAFAALVGLAVLLAKLLGLTIDWLKSKYSEEDKEKLNGVNGVIPMVQLDPETLKFLRNMNIELERSTQLIEEHIQDENETVASVREIATCMKDISHTQSRLAKQFDERVDRFDTNLRRVHDDVLSLKQH